MGNPPQSEPSFGTRLGLAVRCFWRTAFEAGFARQVASLVEGGQPAKPTADIPLPPERQHAAGLVFLSMLQREGRLIDFLQEDVAGFPDQDIGAAARVVHTGCRKVLDQCLTLEPVFREEEGATVVVPPGFDPHRVRLTGNVAGQPPFRGHLKHHGWVTTAVRLPAVSEDLDPRVLAPAEVEL